MSDFDPSDWLFTTWGSVGDVVLTALGIYTVLIVYTRMAGLRTFSKMSSFDFALTVAIGSIVAGSILFDGPSLLRAVAALTVVFAMQMGVAVMRERVGWMGALVDNEPILLMTADGVIHENLRRTRVTEGDIRAKLREANVIDLSEVRAVVMETTGDISVLHGPADGAPLDPEVVRGVRDAARLGLSGQDLEAPGGA